MADWYETKNNAWTTLDGVLAAGAVSCPVVDASALPAAFPYMLTLWDFGTYWNPGDDSGMEIVEVTNAVGNTLTIVRAQEGTADVEHASGERAGALITAGMWQQVTGEVDTHEGLTGAAVHGLGTAAVAVLSTDGTFADNADTDVPSEKATNSRIITAAELGFLGAWRGLASVPSKCVVATPYASLAGTTLTDRAPTPKNATLVTDAGSLSPGIIGTARRLTLSGLTNEPSWGDDAAFTVSTGFTIMLLCKPSATTSRILLAKLDATTGSVQAEYGLYFDGSSKLWCTCYKFDNTAIIARYYNASLAGDTAAWHCYVATWDGTTVATGIKLYRDGVQVDDTSLTSGAYAGMSNTTAALAQYYINTAGSVAQQFAGQMAFVGLLGEAITAAQVNEISQRGLAWVAGF